MEQTISLYLELKKGRKADFEVVGLSAAAFAEAVKEVAFILDPGMECRLEFESGTEGSLSLNAILRSDDGRAGTLLGVIIGVSVMFVSDIRQWSVGRLLDYYFAPEARQQLSDEDIERIARAVRDVSDGKIARVQKQKVYRQLDRDPAIESVGTITRADTKPPDPVPRTDFQIRAGIVRPVETSSRTRITTITDRLTLISPVLLPTDRVWRFHSPFGEFSYHVADEKFLSDLLSGRRKLAMKEGIQLTAKIDIEERFEGGVWVPVRRTLTEVVRVHHKRSQSDLFAKAKKTKSRKKKKR